MPSNETTTINVGFIADAEGDKFWIKNFEIQNYDFKEFVKLINITDSGDDQIQVEVNPPMSLAGNMTSIIVTLADLNQLNPKEEKYRIVVIVTANPLTDPA